MAEKKNKKDKKGKILRSGMIGKIIKEIGIRGEMTNVDHDEEDARRYASVIGERIGTYILLLNLPDGKKELLLEIVEMMDTEKLIQLHDILEAMYIGQCANGYDKYYLRDLEREFDKTEAKKEKILEQTANKIIGLTDKLKQKMAQAQIQ